MLDLERFSSLEFIPDLPLYPRLSHATLRNAAPDVRQPGFDPSSLQTGILHLGCGAFHRGHQALATQRAIEAEGQSGRRWGIASASLIRPTTPDLLRRQDGLYTLIERRESGPSAEIVGTLREVVHAPSDMRGLPARLADPGTRIVTLTVTASGYLLKPSTGRLDPSHRDIRADLANPARPKTAIGIIAAGLDLVRRAGTAPPVILSCDNVSQNGRTLRRAVADFAALYDDALSAWILRNVRFPNTMVDRIVPPVSDCDCDDALRLTGLRDGAPVSAEPFLQWVIEDFDGPRPRWEAAGARFVNDVEPFECAKLRLLNGTHMLLAYLGSLAGYSTIADTIADPVFYRLAREFMLTEQGATVDMSDEAREAYVGQLIRRIRNPAIHHDVVRIGRNGSTKMATRLMEPLRENLEAGRDVKCAILTIAAWIRSFALRNTSGTTVKTIDPRRDALKDLCEEVGEDHLLQARKFLAMEGIFGKPLPPESHVVEELARTLRSLHLYPVKEVVRRHLSSAGTALADNPFRLRSRSGSSAAAR